METKELLERALQIAAEAHRGQTDKAGADYIGHPKRVAARCATDPERIVAILHDTVEDTWVTPERLLAEGFPQTIVDSVLSVTRREGETYGDFIARAALDPVGRAVKLHDLEDNMDLNRLPHPAPEDYARLEKYRRAYDYLTHLDN